MKTTSDGTLSGGGIVRAAAERAGAPLGAATQAASTEARQNVAVLGNRRMLIGDVKGAGRHHNMRPTRLDS